MRRYWIPAALSSELSEPDGPPIRLKLLGEQLVAFRDTRGRVGLLNEFCAHRGTSLFLGRNEECGLRCVYHGWKYDVEGNCVDMPTEPAESNFKSKIHLKAYPTVELGGVVWAYLGPRDGTPPPPNFEWTRLSPAHKVVTRTLEECNWLQALEGGIDSMHASTLHTVLTPHTTRAGLRGIWTKPTALKDEVELTDYGHVYASIRPMEDDTLWVRVYHYVMPFHTFFPYELGEDGKDYKPVINGHIFVPLDDENTMVYNWIGKFGEEPLADAERDALEQSRGRGPGEITLDFRKVRNKRNNWLIDRQVQKTETYSGIEGINTQDHAVQESMGPIVDRTQEHLGGTDVAAIATRRLLLRAVRTVEAGGDPPGVGPTYYTVRAIERIVSKGTRWQEALRDLFNPSGVTQPGGRVPGGHLEVVEEIAEKPGRIR
jgi:nitrite reductase/ring-hydroxylating ferredoxin subunit